MSDFSLIYDFSKGIQEDINDLYVGYDLYFNIVPDYTPRSMNICNYRKWIKSKTDERNQKVLYYRWILDIFQFPPDIERYILYIILAHNKRIKQHINRLIIQFSMWYWLNKEENISGTRWILCVNLANEENLDKMCIKYERSCEMFHYYSKYGYIYNRFAVDMLQFIKSSKYKHLIWGKCILFNMIEHYMFPKLNSSWEEIDRWMEQIKNSKYKYLFENEIEFFFPNIKTMLIYDDHKLESNCNCKCHICKKHFEGMLRYYIHDWNKTYDHEWFSLNNVNICDNCSVNKQKYVSIW